MSKINETAEYKFVVKDASDFEYYITIEPNGNDGISIFENAAMLSFYLKRGTSRKKAHKIADFLNENIEFLNFQEI